MCNTGKIHAEIQVKGIQLERVQAIIYLGGQMTDIWNQSVDNRYRIAWGHDINLGCRRKVVRILRSFLRS